MPYVLVRQLKQLMEMEFPSQLKSKNPYLGKSPTTLPDEILEAIDAVSDTASKLFGPRIQPDARQANIMAANGFPVAAGKIDNCVWKNGVITTPKGLIEYK